MSELQKVLEHTMKIVLLINFLSVRDVSTRSGLFNEAITTNNNNVLKCRTGCLEKFATEDFTCLQGPECLLNGFKTFNFKNFPAALRLLCWDECDQPPDDMKTNRPMITDWTLDVLTMTRHGSLVSADIVWPKVNDPTQCLVTWEVAGGGLMGNLLTDSSSVELSLWPETEYNIQVTCKNKATNQMLRSKMLTLDTTSARDGQATIDTTSATTPTTTTMTTTTTTPTTTTTSKIMSDVEMFDRNNHLKYHLPTSDRVSLNKLSTNNNKNRLRTPTLFSVNIIEFSLGLIMAVVIFSIVLSLLIVVKRRKSRDDEKLLISDDLLSECLANETTNHQHSITVHV